MLKTEHNPKETNKYMKFIWKYYKVPHSFLDQRKEDDRLKENIKYLKFYLLLFLVLFIKKQTFVSLFSTYLFLKKINTESIFNKI